MSKKDASRSLTVDDTAGSLYGLCRPLSGVQSLLPMYAGLEKEKKAVRRIRASYDEDPRWSGKKMMGTLALPLCIRLR